MFIGREQELEYFEEKYSTPDAQMIVLYGRRRIGKTELLRRFCSGKPHVFFSCREVPDWEQLRSFSERILIADNPAARYINTFRDWESAFRGILEMPHAGKRLLIIDEFPYMCRSNHSVPSVLQNLWDESLKDENIMIVLCGSSMSFIEKEILSGKSPLYGRATGIYKLGELPFHDAVQFFPGYSNEDKMLVYSILGGIPHYLRQFNAMLSLRENIMKNILTKGCVLYNEVEFLIRQELREVSLYNTIIEAVAFGNTRLNDIFTKTQIDKAKISVYLKNLMELQIIEREFSVLSGEKEKATSTRGLYQIADKYFRFWYRFVSPNLSDLETGDADGVLTHAIEPYLNDFTASTFEIVCREFLRRKSQLGKLPFRVSKLGRWWGKLNKEALVENGKRKMIGLSAEIDIVATDADTNNYILGECKYRNETTGVAILDKLKHNSPFGINDNKVHYALFSKSKFTTELTSLAEKDPTLLLFSLSDIIGGL